MIYHIKVPIFCLNIKVFYDIIYMYLFLGGDFMIQVNNLTYIYQKKDLALDDISFEIKDGEFVSILGHNGSGKSTLSKILVGLLEPTKGNVKINNLDLNEKNINEIRKNVGIVFQNPDNQFVGVSVKHDIAFGMENREIPRDEMLRRIDEYIKKVDMERYIDAEPHTLSGGQKQRVAIAGILALNTDIIILDEATSMLDPEGVIEIKELIKSLKGKKTIISITHDLDFARLSDRVIVLRDGKIIKDCTPDEAFNDIESLQSSRLDIPFNLKLYNEAKKNNLNKDVVDALWELNLKK